MLVMTTYTITATWGAMKLSEEMDVRSDLAPENETRYAENFILDKWRRVFGEQFIEAADDVTTRALASVGINSHSVSGDSKVGGGA